jgi:glycosyltransferase involved in cell wall biosynthesis
VGLLARCVPGKGYEEFIRAASIICRQDSKAQFLIVGNGHGGDQAHEIQMQELAKQLKLQQRLLWAGWQRDTAAILDLLDIVVQASSTFPEGLSRVLLEAMAHGRPVVATSLPSTQEIITHGETGLLVEPGNSQALAEGILTLLRQPELAARYARRGREHVAAHFSLTEHARRITTLYDEVLGIGPGNGRRSERGTRSQVLAGDWWSSNNRGQQLSGQERTGNYQLVGTRSHLQVRDWRLRGSWGRNGIRQAQWSTGKAA